MDMSSGAGNIPDELLENIGRCLNTKSDVSRFRAVCKSLRSSIPPFKNLLQFPRAEIYFEDDDNWQAYTLVESAVYHLAPPADDPHKRGWLINVQEEESGETRVLQPLSRFVGGHLPKSFPEVLNLLDFRVFEVAKMYSLRSSDEEGFTNFKAVASVDLDFPAFMVIDNYGTLYYGKLGGHVIKCINISEQLDPVYGDFDDVIFYQGKFCAVCDDGRAVAFDSCLNWKLIAYPLAKHTYDGHEKKNMVESMGELLLVDRHSYYNHRCNTTVNRFRIFKLKANEKRWVELDVEALDDRILVLGDDGCYYLSSRDFPGCKGGSIYFNDPDHAKPYKHELARMLSHIGVFHLDYSGSRILRLADFPTPNNIFHPPPNWTWPDMPDSRRHDQGEDSESTSGPARRRRKIV